MRELRTDSGPKPPRDKPVPGAKKTKRGGRLARLRQPYDPLTSLVLVIPVFLVYHLGILAIDSMNGVDLVSMVFFGILKQSVALYVAVTLGFAAAMLGAGYVLKRRGRANVFAFAPVVAESTLWALGMFLVGGWATAKIVGGAMLVAPHGPGHALQVAAEARVLSPFAKVIMSAGAGFHEELVFRVILFGGLMFVLRRVFKQRAPWALLIALLVSSFAFSFVHYLGPLGDSFTLGSFVFRIIVGIYLGLLYRFRGFAVAVYAHAIYDVIFFFFVAHG